MKVSTTQAGTYKSAGKVLLSDNSLATEIITDLSDDGIGVMAKKWSLLRAQYIETINQMSLKGFGNIDMQLGISTLVGLVKFDMVFQSFVRFS
jgi:hypothetical protein